METMDVVKSFFENQKRVVKKEANCNEGEFVKFWYYRSGGPLDGDFDLWIKLDNKEIKKFIGHGYALIEYILRNYSAGGSHMNGDRLKIWHIGDNLIMIENISLNELNCKEHRNK